MIINGQPGHTHNWAGDLVFSPDGKRFAYLAKTRNSMRVFHDQGSVRFDVVVQGSLVFSDDSQHLAFLAGNRKTKRAHVYLDGSVKKSIFDWEEIAAAVSRIPPEKLTAQMGENIIRD